MTIRIINVCSKWSISTSSIAIEVVNQIRGEIARTAALVGGIVDLSPVAGELSEPGTPFYLALSTIFRFIKQTRTNREELESHQEDST